MNDRRALLRFEVPFGVFGASLVALAFVFAITGIPSWIPPAPLVRLGVPSPLTGMTRSFVALASGDVRAAFEWHPLGPLLFSACVATPLVAIVSWVGGSRLQPLTRVLHSRAFVISVVAVVVMAWVRQAVAL